MAERRRTSLSTTSTGDEEAVVSVSDRTLRGLAWAVWSFVAAMFAVAVALALVAEPLTGKSSGGNTADVLGFAALALTFPLVGLLIVRRQPRNTIGWLLLGIGLVWGLAGFADNYVRYGLLVDPGSLPRPDVVAGLAGGVWAPGIGIMGTFLLLLYPDGHLPSPRWRPVGWLSAVTIAALFVVLDLSPGQLVQDAVPTLQNPLGWQAAQPVLSVLLKVLAALLPLCILACAVALVRRFRRSVGIERLQLKWLAAAGALVALLYLLSMAATLLSALLGAPGGLAWFDSVAFLSFVLLPIAIGVAILRHRLYDVDVVINRALVYGSLTAALAGTYLGSVLLLQLLLGPLTSQSDLAVAGSTLAVAALFRPARARIQSIVDRRFYRRRYDAARTLDAFAGRLRSELDLDAVGADLRAAVRETVQPAHLSLWLRP